LPQHLVAVVSRAKSTKWPGVDEAHRQLLACHVLNAQAPPGGQETRKNRVVLAQVPETAAWACENRLEVGSIAQNVCFVVAERGRAATSSAPVVRVELSSEIPVRKKENPRDVRPGRRAGYCPNVVSGKARKKERRRRKKDGRAVLVCFGRVPDSMRGWVPAVAKGLEIGIALRAEELMVGGINRGGSQSRA